MNHKHEAPCTTRKQNFWGIPIQKLDLSPMGCSYLKNCKLYTLCTFILSNPPHLTVGLKLILIQNEY